MNYPQIAAAVYQACTRYDQYLPALSVDVAQAWAKVFEKYQLSPEDLLEGVETLYSEKGHGYRPMPADIALAARNVRRDRAAKEPRAVSDARMAALAAKAAEDAEELAERKGLPGLDKFRRRPPPAALKVRCPWCKANIGNRCVVPNTNERPAGGFHTSRIEAASVTA